MPAAPEPRRGLTATELAAAVAALQPLCGATVLDVVPVAGPELQTPSDDLVLVLQEPGGAKVFVLLAPGGTRARIGTTSRRWPKDAFQRGPQADVLHRQLAGAVLAHLTAVPGERRGAVGFHTSAGDRRLAFELFGARGLWALLDAEGRVLLLPREVTTAVRTLRLGEPYTPPPPSAATTADPPPRFAAPVLPAIDAHFTGQDLAVARGERLASLRRAAERALARATAQRTGLQQKLADTDRSTQLRATADLMLAYAHTVRRGADTMTVPDLDTGAPRTLALDPSRPVVVQAQALYEKARRLDDGRAIAEQRLATADAAQAALAPLVASLATLPATAPDLDLQLDALQRALATLGALPPPPRPRAGGRPRPTAPPGENYRRFVSIEGYPILVGRNNEQNDRLTLRTARGNDLWLHVGGGRPGSHVVIRLPKGKTASLDSLLDAGTLAVHFSKARGEARIEVIYTLKKHVRKPKGLPAGAVVPSQTKSLHVHHDPERLRRLLDSAGQDDADDGPT